MSLSRWSFSTTLTRPEGVGTWTFAPIPVDIARETGIKARLRVKGTIDGVPFKGTLLPGGSGKHFVVVNKGLREKIGKAAGDVVKVEMDADASKVTVDIPRELAKALSSRPGLKARFDKMAPSHRKAYALWIEGAKTGETRSKRVAKATAMIALGETL